MVELEGGAPPPAIPRVLFTEGEISQRVREMGGAISNADPAHPPLLVGMLRGALPFTADLARSVEGAEIEFLAISSYAGGSGPPGRVRIEKDLDVDVTGRRVIVVEDVVDTGFTLSYLMGVLEARGPASLEVATLLDKRARRIVEVPLTYAGFEIADEFVLGYGLDQVQRYRNLPFIFAADDLDALIADPEFYMEGALELLRGGEGAQAAAK